VVVRTLPTAPKVRRLEIPSGAVFDPTSLHAGEQARLRILPSSTECLQWSLASGPGTLSGDTYTAPPTLLQDESVKIQATAQDGSSRTAKLTLRLIAPPPSFRIVEPSQGVVAAGSRHQFEVTPKTAVAWSVEQGPGSFGDPSSSLGQGLERDFEPLQRELPAQPAVLSQSSAIDKYARIIEAPQTFGSSPGGASGQQPLQLDVKQFLPDSKLVDGIGSKLRANLVSKPDLQSRAEKLYVEKSTYRAPLTTREEQVVIKATALDGSGRAATATIKIRPQPRVPVLRPALPVPSPLTPPGTVRPLPTEPR
jgi:hypothetical protein